MTIHIHYINRVNGKTGHPTSNPLADRIEDDVIAHCEAHFEEWLQSVKNDTAGTALWCQARVRYLGLLPVLRAIPTLNIPDLPKEG